MYIRTDQFPETIFLDSVDLKIYKPEENSASKIFTENNACITCLVMEVTRKTNQVLLIDETLNKMKSIVWHLNYFIKKVLSLY